MSHEGNTMVLVYEDVLAISKTLDEIEKEKGWNIPIHVDAASGGFLGILYVRLKNF